MFSIHNGIKGILIELLWGGCKDKEIPFIVLNTTNKYIRVALPQIKLAHKVDLHSSGGHLTRVDKCGKLSFTMQHFLDFSNGKR